MGKLEKGCKPGLVVVRHKLGSDLGLDCKKEEVDSWLKEVRHIVREELNKVEQEVVVGHYRNSKEVEQGFDSRTHHSNTGQEQEQEVGR